MPGVIVRIDEAALGRFLSDRAGPVAQHLLKRGRRVESAAKVLCGAKSGRLRGSIHTELVIGAPGGVLSGVGPLVFIGTNVEYALYHHEGTGIYGPTHSPIVPRNARVLRWTDRSTGKATFAKSVRGSPGHHFLLSALETERGRSI